MESPALPFSKSRFWELRAELLEQTSRFLARAGLPQEDAEDLVQDVFLRFLEKAATVREPEAWLRKALQDRCIDYRRSQRRRQRRFEELAAEGGPRGGERWGDTGRIRIYDVQRGLASLPERIQAVLLLRFQGDLEPREVAQRLGYQPSSVRVMIHRGLQHLREVLLAGGYRPNKRR